MKLFSRLFNAGAVATLCTALSVAAWSQQAPPPPSGADQSYPGQDQNYPAQDQNYPNQNAPYNGSPEQAGPPPGSDQAGPPPGPDQAGPPPNYGGPNGPNGPNGGNDAGNDQGPPSRVARLQYLSGSVSIQPHGTDDWVQGSVNRPLTNADNIWADKDSRAELNLGTAVLRIGAESSLTMTNVTDNSTQVQLHQGALNVHVRHLYNGEVYEVDTPNLAFTITKPGDYRLDVDPNADYTLVTVWGGEGQATGQGQPVTVHSGEQARFSNGTSLAHDVHAAPQPDQFDDWCRVRDQHADHSASAKYVSPDVIGSEDLDEYGTWKQSPEYGNVWQPSGVGPDWAPYTYGHWVWIAPWGWTWVDDAPWGFAPFHYGRWVYWGGGWGWAPGPYVGPWYRGWWAPGLVAWFGGPHWGVGVGFGGFGFGIGGGFGWCALGWGEPFFPWYHAGWGYFRGVNVYNTRIVNINNYHGTFNNFAAHGTLTNMHYANMSRPGGFTAVSANTLQHGLPVHNNMVHVPASAARSAPAVGRPGVTPSHSAMLGPKAGSPAAHPSAAVTSRPTVSRMTPPASSRGATSAAARSNTNTAARTNAGNTARPAAENSGARNVPRPPSAANESSRPTGESANRSTPSNNSGRSVPRPPSASNESSRAATSTARSAESARSSAPSSSSIRNVPRPSGPVQPAPRSYSAGNSASSRASEGASSRSYGSSEGSRSYGGGNEGYSSRSSAGSYGGGLRSEPYGGYSGGYSHGSSSYGSSRSSSGGGHYSAPSHSSGSSHSSGGSHGGGGGHHGR